MRKDLVLIGRIVGAHGIKGEVKLQSFAAEPEAIARYGALRTERNETIEIEKLRSQKQGFVAVLKGVRDRNRAEALSGSELFIERSRLPAAAENETYIHDLVGLAVVTRDGSAFGRIVDVANFGAGDLLDVERPGTTATVLIPFTAEFVPDVDVAAGRITIDLPEGYLDET
jgi:16S rRNA processing protein RimM